MKRPHVWIDHGHVLYDGNCSMHANHGYSDHLEVSSPASLVVIELNHWTVSTKIHGILGRDDN